MKKEMDYNNICRTEQIRLFTSLPRISSPRKAAFEIMRSAMRVYQADWCGILDVDLTANTYCPYWWIEEGKGEMAETLFHSVELSEFYEGWAEALKKMEPIVVWDRDLDTNVRENEKECYVRLETHAVIGCPYHNHGVTGFLVVRNPRRTDANPSYLSMMSYLISAKIGEQKALDRVELRAEQQEVIGENEVRIRLFGGICIQTKGYELQEKDLNSPGSWNILVYLLLHRKRNYTTQELSEMDCNTEYTDDKKKSVRQKINRFNQKFRLISKYDLIVREDLKGKEAKYQINPNLKVWLDCEVYDDLMRQAQLTTNRKVRLDLIKKAIRLYEGTAYPSQELADWFVSTAAYYRRRNLENFNEVAKYLDQKKDYRELLEYSMLVYKAMPEEMDGYYWMACCMKKLHWEREARRIIEEAKNRISEEVGEEIWEKVFA